MVFTKILNSKYNITIEDVNSNKILIIDDILQQKIHFGIKKEIDNNSITIKNCFTDPSPTQRIHGHESLVDENT